MEVGNGEEEKRLPLESRPGVVFVGSPNVGKRTLLSRLLSIDISDEPNSLSGVNRQGWTIDTKYYSADLCVWTAHLDEDFSIATLRAAQQLAALVLVFDMNNASTFNALKNWVPGVDLSEFDILLCVGNKVDLLPGHPAHVEYRRRLQRQRESADPEPVDFGIAETDGTRLLAEDDPSFHITTSYVDWCSQHNIEFLEACASNADFDKCLSVEGDVQGVDRILGALSAHMWPGMVLKTGERIINPTLSEAETTDEDSDFEVDYERLSAGSEDQWTGFSSSEAPIHENGASSTECSSSTEKKVEEAATIEEPALLSNGSNGWENLEQLMNEMGSLRESLRLMPDFRRREEAAKLAMKMAAMFDHEDADSDG
ncbi:GTP binding protein [Wolffia australiana]